MILALILATLTCNAHPQYHIKPIVTSVQMNRERDGYRASAQIFYALQTTTMAKIPRSDPALHAHVAGHGIVARRVAASSTGLIEAVGTTRDQARARLHATILRLAADLQRELEREERAYDNITENGAAQTQGPSFGFPGGPDSRVPCPRLK